MWELAHWHIGTLAHWHISTFSRFAQRTVYRVRELAHWQIGTLAHWHISTLTKGLLAIAREPVGGRRFKESKS